MKSKTSSDKTFSFSLETLGIIVGFSSVLAALAWFFGSMYYSGYYKALGIRGNFITYSNEFLIGQGVLKLFSPLFLTFYLYLLLVLERNLSRDSADKIIQITKRLKLSNKTNFFIITIIANLIMIGLAYFSFVKIRNSQIPVENVLLFSVIGVVVALFFMDIMIISYKELGDSDDIKKYNDNYASFEGMYRKVCKWLKLGTGLQSEWQAG